MIVRFTTAVSQTTRVMKAVQSITGSAISISSIRLSSTIQPLVEEESTIIEDI